VTRLTFHQMSARTLTSCQPPRADKYRKAPFVGLQSLSPPLSSPNRGARPGPLRPPDPHDWAQRQGQPAATVSGSGDKYTIQISIDGIPRHPSGHRPGHRRDRPVLMQHRRRLGRRVTERLHPAAARVGLLRRASTPDAGVTRVASHAATGTGENHVLRTLDDDDLPVRSALTTCGRER